MSGGRGVRDACAGCLRRPRLRWAWPDRACRQRGRRRHEVHLRGGRRCAPRSRSPSRSAPELSLVSGATRPEPRHEGRRPRLVRRELAGLRRPGRHESRPAWCAGARRRRRAHRRRRQPARPPHGRARDSWCGRTRRRPTLRCRRRSAPAAHGRGRYLIVDRDASPGLHRRRERRRCAGSTAPPAWPAAASTSSTRPRTPSNSRAATSPSATPATTA